MSNNHETTHNHREAEKPVFTLPKARAFVEQNIVELPQEATPLQSKYLACIDGRVKDAHKFRVPGGALGIEFAVFAGLEKWEEYNVALESLNIKPEDTSRIIEQTLGGMSCHSDTHAEHKGNKFPCAGCGHCNGALQNPNTYHLQKYAPYLYSRVNSIKPEVYEGGHREQAVIVISKAETGKRPISIPGTGVDGTQAFICHIDDYFETVEAIMQNVGEFISEKLPNLNIESLQKSGHELAQIHLNATLLRLAKGLPRFVLNPSDRGLVSL